MTINKSLNKIIIIAIFTLSSSCSKNDGEQTYIPVSEITEIPDAPYIIDSGIFPTPTIASDNPLTREGVLLGRMLFYEKKLSKDQTIACASCHKQEDAFSDSRKLSIGIKNLPGTRHSMAIFNMAWNSNEFFWDGRAHLLRDQSLMPILDPLEMDETLENITSKLQASTNYPKQFKRAFGTNTISPLLISKAMEQFMNSIVSNQSKYDKFLAGTETLTTTEERGRFLFFTEYNPSFPNASGADCAHCHGGDNFENDKYMNNGLDIDFIDFGRQNVTGNASDKAKFKVPSLRNVALTAPYMHDGRFNTLDQVINHYNLVKQSATLDGAFYQQLPSGLQLTASDKSALVDYLKTLSDSNLTTNPKYSSPF